MLVAWPVARAIEMPTPELRARDVCACDSHHWKEGLMAANLEAGRFVACAVLSHWKVRLVFANGAWIEFRPSSSAVADGALPQMVAMQLGAGDRGR